MASLKDISKICGVSVATVSKALNDHKDIGEETKANIRRVAKEMGYSPNLSARALKTNRTYGIGVLFADEARSGLTHDYFSSVLDSFKRTAEKSGYDITFINSCKNRPDRMSYLEHSRYRGFDGVVLACIDFGDPEVIELVQSSIPVVTIDYLFNNRIAIMSDNVTGMKELLEYIYSRGHRKIAYIHGAMSAVTSGRLSSFYRTADAWDWKSRMSTFGKQPTEIRRPPTGSPTNCWICRIHRHASSIRMTLLLSEASTLSDREDYRSLKISR